MKLNKLFVAMLAPLALAACTSDKDVPDNNSPLPDNGEARFLSVTIRNTGIPGTRAAGDQSGNTYEEGLGGENAVSNVRFYFFQADGSAFPVANGSLNYLEISNPKESDGNNPSQNMPNVEKIYKSVLVINGQGVDFTKLKSMVAVVNYNKSDLGTGSKSLEELQKIVGDYSISAFYNNQSENIPNMLMTSAVYDTAEQFEGCETFISPSKLKTNTDEALNDPVEIYVERVLAKVRVTTNWDSNVYTTTVDGSVLVKLKDKDGKDMKSSEDKDLYVKFNSWGIQTFAEKSYLFKNIGQSTTSWDLGNWWNDAPNHRSYWAINPSGVTYKHATHTAANGRIATTLSKTENNVTTTIVYDGDFAYVQENAGDNSADGHKANYKPSAETSNRTQVYVNATIVDETGKAVSLAKFGSEYYTQEGVQKAMLGTINHQIWIKKSSTTSTDTETTTDKEWITIPESFVKLVNAQDIDKADNKTETSKRYLSYLQLKSTKAAELFTGDYAEYNQKFYDANHNEISIDEVNEMLAGIPGVKVWQDGMTYYYADLKHLNTGEGNEEKGMYGVVRNHIYEVEIKSVKGLGTPVLIPDKDHEREIIPQTPEDDEYFLGARINILSWRIVPNNITLNW